MAKNFHLDLKKFRKIAHDEHSTTLQHIAGHKLTVAHKPLSKAMRDGLKALPIHKAKIEGAKADEPKLSKKQEQVQGSVQHMAHGGPVQMYAEGTPDEPVQPAQAPVVVNVGQPQGAPLIPEALANPAPGAQAMQQAGQMTPQQQAMAAPEALPYGVNPEQVAATPQAAAAPQQAIQQAEAPAASPTAASPSPPDPYGVNAYNEAYMTGLNEQKAGLAQQAVAEGAMGQAQAKALNEGLKQQQLQQDAFKKHYDMLDSERQGLMKDYAAGHIDPQHYWKEKSTLGKVSTAIGLILGGITFNGQNGAMDFFNKQIDRDIHAQQANLDKQNNLLSANLKHFGNMRDATDMTRIMQMDMLSSKLKAEAAKASGPLARAKALEAAGKLDQTAAPILSQIAMRRTLVGGTNAGTVDPSTVVRMIVPEHQQAGAYKELKEAQDTTAFRDNALGAFDKIAKLATISGVMGSPMQNPREINAIKQPLTAALSKNTAGRFTEQDAGMLESLWPSRGDNEQTLATKRMALQKLSSEKMHFPMLDAYGIKVGGRFDSNGAKKIQLGAPVK